MVTSAAKLILSSGCGNFESEPIGIKDLVVSGRKVSGVDTGNANVIGNGSIISVPEGAVAIVLDHGGIEQVLETPGEHVYYGNQRTRQEALHNIRIMEGACTTDKRIIYVNMKEIPDNKFGLRNAAPYYDMYYGVELDIYAYGSFSIQVMDPVKVVECFVGGQPGRYNLGDVNIHQQLLVEFRHIFLAALTKISANCRISHLQSMRGELVQEILAYSAEAYGFEQRFGFRIASVAIEEIIYSEESKALIGRFNERLMGIKAYENVSREVSDIAAQQKIADGIKAHGYQTVNIFNLAREV